MANLLTKTFHPGFRGQSGEVIGDRQNRPVCLDACPGSHKHLSEAQVLLDILVKDLDREALGVNPRHSGFTHVECVGDKEAGLASQAGDEKPHPSHSGQPHDLRSDTKVLFLGNPDLFVAHPPLGQKRGRDFDSVQVNVTVLFQGRHKSPARLLNRVENRSASVPSIHHDGEPSWEKEESFFQNLQGKGDFAFESPGLRDFLGRVAADRKGKAPAFKKAVTAHRPFSSPLAE